MITGYENILERGSRLKKLLAASATALALSVALAMPAHADLAAVGPVNTDPAAEGSGQDFPFWMQDQGGLRLDLCIDGPPNCLTSPGDLTPPDGEAFWFSAANTFDTSAGADTGAVEMATEAAYFDGAAAFNRIRIRIDVENPGTYTVSYPYGEKTFDVAQGETGIKAINFTQDDGCTAPPCGNFASSAQGEIDRFLTWNTFGNTGPGAPPAGYIVDASTPLAVIASTIPAATDPSGFRNYVKVEGPGIAPDGGDVVVSRLFTVEGKISGVTAFANPKGGTFNHDLSGADSVKLTASDPAAEIRYTTGDGNQADPTADSGEVYDPATGIDVTDGNATGNGEATTVVKFMAIVRDDAGAVTSESPVLSQTYNIDTLAPEAPSQPELDAASDSGAKGDNITNDTTPTFNGTAEAGSTVALFVDGVKKGSAVVTGGSYSVTANGALTSDDHSITAEATDVAGNTGVESGALNVTVDSIKPKVTASPGSTTLGPTQKVTLTANEPADIFFTTDTTTPDDRSDHYTQPLSFTANTTLRYMAVDTAGNASADPAPQNYTIDGTGPKVATNSH